MKYMRRVIMHYRKRKGVSRVAIFELHEKEAAEKKLKELKKNAKGSSLYWLDIQLVEK